MLILELLVVDEGAREKEAQVVLVIILIRHWIDLTNIAIVDCDMMEFLGVKVLNNYFGSIILCNIHCNKVLKAIKLRDYEVFG